MNPLTFSILCIMLLNRAHIVYCESDPLASEPNPDWGPLIKWMITEKAKDRTNIFHDINVLPRPQRPLVTPKPSSLSFDLSQLDDVEMFSISSEGALTTWTHPAMDLFSSFIIKLNCVGNEDQKPDFNLLSRILSNVSLVNGQYDHKDRKNIYLSLVPGIVSVNHFEENLSKIQGLIQTQPGHVVGILLDFTFFNVGPFDSNSIKEKWALCEATRVGTASEPYCGFIFDDHICTTKSSLFSTMTWANLNLIFINYNSKQTTDHGEATILNEYFSCTETIVATKSLNPDTATSDIPDWSTGLFRGLARGLVGTLVGGVTFVANKTHFTLENQILIPSDEHFLGPNVAAVWGNKSCPRMSTKNLSPMSSTQWSSVTLPASVNTLCLLLTNHSDMLSNGTQSQQQFFNLFTRFMVDISGNTADFLQTLKLPRLFTEVIHYRSGHKDTFDLMPFTLDISYTPQHELENELESILKHVSTLNEAIPGTVTGIVLNYNQLRVNSLSHFLVKKDVETCNLLTRNTSLTCGYIFNHRNCLQTDGRLGELPFPNGTMVLIRDATHNSHEHCQYILPQCRVQQLENAKLTFKGLKVDLKTNTFAYNQTELNAIETWPKIRIAHLETQLAEDSYKATSAKRAEYWLAQPFEFSERVEFIARLGKVQSKEVWKFAERRNMPVVLVLNADTLTKNTSLNLNCNIFSTTNNTRIMVELQLDGDVATFVNISGNLLSLNQLCGNRLSAVHIDWMAMAPKLDDNQFNTSVIRERFDILVSVVKQIGNLQFDSLEIVVINPAEALRNSFKSQLTTTQTTSDQDPLISRWQQQANSVLPTRVSDILQREIEPYLRVFDVGKLYSIATLVNSHMNQFDVDLEDIKDRSYVASQHTIKRFESATHTSMDNMPLVKQFTWWKGMTIKLNIVGCKDTLDVNSLIDYAEYLEYINNWAQALGQTVILEAFYNSADGRCDTSGSHINVDRCTCGWWIWDEETSQFIDTKEKARILSDFRKEKKSFMENLTQTEILGTVLPILIILLTITIVVFWRVFHTKSIFTKQQVKNFLYKPERGMGVGENEYAVFKADLELQKSQITIDTTQIAGRGESGAMVYKGWLHTKSSKLEVIVKAFKAEKGVQLDNKKYFALMGLISEAKILGSLSEHVNLVKFYGAYIKNLVHGELLVVLEYCPLGSLDKYLGTYREEALNSPDGSIQSETAFSSLLPCMATWCLEIASGLEYLTSHRVVHADIAARNILLDAAKTCKISDFGLSRRAEMYKTYLASGCVPYLPWRWMAPESLRKLAFNEKTDVWMFAVTIWEIYTYCEVPYGGLAFDGNYIKLLEGGLRPQIPPSMPPRISDLVQGCWEGAAERRPTFTFCVKALENISSIGDIG